MLAAIVGFIWIQAPENRPAAILFLPYAVGRVRLGAQLRALSFELTPLQAGQDESIMISKEYIIVDGDHSKARYRPAKKTPVLRWNYSGCGSLSHSSA
jgi:hypothetical protein